MPRRTIGLLITLAFGLLVAPLVADAQPVGKVYRIGYLALGVSPTASVPYQGLEAFREAVPAASHVAAVHPRSNPASPSLPGLGALTFFIRETEAAAKALGVQLTSVELGRDPRGWDHAFQAMVSDGIAALFVHQNPGFFANRAYLAELAARHRLPTMYQVREYVEAGGLMAYGPNIEAADRRVATY